MDEHTTGAPAGEGESHHGLQKIGTIILILIVLVAVIFFLGGSGSLNLSSVDREKQEILSQVGESDVRLSDEEKDALLEQLGGTKIDRYHFTDEEKLSIIRALNR